MLLQGSWEDAEPLKLMTRQCTTCNHWTIYEYFEDGDELWGICWRCESLVKRMQKCYIQNMMNNPIHKQEVVLWESPRFQELAQDKIVDVGYTPDHPPLRILKPVVKRLTDGT